MTESHKEEGAVYSERTTGKTADVYSIGTYSGPRSELSDWILAVMLFDRKEDCRKD